jgi:hypothetical protein
MAMSERKIFLEKEPEGQGRLWKESPIRFSWSPSIPWGIEGCLETVWTEKNSQALFQIREISPKPAGSHFF